MTLRIIVISFLIAYVGTVALYLRFGSWPLKRKCFAIIALTCAWVFPWLALESLAVLRLVDYRIAFSTPFRKAFENPVNRLDPELLHLHRPHAVYTGDAPGDLVGWYGLDTTRRYRADVQYDRNGFRNVRDLERAEVVVIGDSFVEGPLIAQEDLLTTHLEQALGTPVLNLGQTGYGPQQELAVLKRFALPAQPRVVVWMVFEGNDLTHDFQRYERSVADWPQYSRKLNGWSARSFTRNALMFGIRSLTPPPDKSPLGLRRFGLLQVPPEMRGERKWFAYEQKPFAPSDEACIDGSLEIFDKARRICAERGVRFMLVLVPIAYRVYHDLCTFPPDSDIHDWILTDVPDRLRDWSENAGVEFIDLAPPLREAAQTKLVFFLDDGHWNEHGHAVAADVIAERIKASEAHVARE